MITDTLLLLLKLRMLNLRICVIVTLLNQDNPVHFPVLSDLVEWCDSAFLNINVEKNKEMIIHFG